MALQYATGTPSSTEDLIDKLQTFAALHGWTVDNYDASGDECSIHESNCYVHFAWDNSPGTQIAIYHSTGYNVANAINAQPGDSGNGGLVSGRRLSLGAAGPYTAYHFFADDASPRYLHVVVEVSSGIFRHMHLGTLIKSNDYTGGEYAAGHIWTTGAPIDDPTSASHCVGLDGAHTTAANCATVRCVVGNMAGAETWALVTTSGAPGTDTDGEVRATVLGSSRGGLWARFMAHIRNSVLNAYVPIIPIHVWYRDVADTPDTFIWLGQQPNIGIVNLHNFSAGDEVTLGGETWKVFPWARKQYLENSTEESWNAGYAYRKS